MTTIFLPLLADRQGQPAGLVLAAAAGLPAAIAPRLALLAAVIPCHFPSDVAAPLAAALQAAGWRPLPAARVLRTDVPFVAELPADVDWLEGDWPLAPPGKPADGQGMKQQAASRALALQLVQLVNADADTHEIEALLRRDATLSYHLLRLVNSLGMGTGRKVSSFAQAILILGRQQLRRWLNLMLFAARDGDLRSAMLLARVAVRARLMELLARATGLDRHRQEQAFMTGMFSLLGALFGSPLADVLAPLAIGDAVRQALLARDGEPGGLGELGELLALVEAAERGAFAAVAAALDRAQLPADEFNAIVVDANLWMLSVTHEVNADVAGNVTGRRHA